MSVLLVGLDAELVTAVTRRLTAQGDQVRIVARSGEPVPGAHVAVGDPGDDDLVERAAQGARTIVAGEEGRAAALAGAARAGVDRAVLVGGDAAGAPASMSWVLLVTKRRLRRGVAPADVAEAVDAADDMAGEPRLVVDLTTEDGWRALRLDPR
ncbi:MAG TPA: hypothetical protein VHN37_07930 [Actinomycetota bacterium]|nr:hypothetical protein [Actinomycetota bacterium]